MNEVIDNVKYVPRHIGHHGSHSGYDTLFPYMGLAEARSTGWVRASNWLPKSLRWRLWDLRPQATQQQGLEAELGALPWVIRGKGRLCHFIYGEDTFFYTPLWKRGGNLTVATFHYPPDRLYERVNPGSLRGLDAVIIVGENQRDFFRRYFPDERIFYCPHHIDTDFFRPAENAVPAEPFKIICVGRLFRDFDALLAAHQSLVESGVSCETNIIAPKNAFGGHAITREPGIHFRSGISDSELLAMYQSSHAGVQPLLDATANNGLLEMIACGLPTVTTAVGGVPGYTKDSSIRLVDKGDAQMIAHHIRELAADPVAAREEGAANRSFAVTHLSREVLAQRMRDIYHTLLSNSHVTKRGD